VGAISVHGTNGLWGVISVGLFADGASNYGGSWNGVDGSVTGLFYGDGKQLLAQFIEVCTAVGWNVVVGGVAFWVIGKVLGSNRVPAEVEIAGLDVPEMGVPGYPEFLPPVAPEQVPPAEVEEAKAALIAARVAMAK